MRHLLVGMLAWALPTVAGPRAQADLIGPAQLPSYSNPSDVSPDVFVTYENYPFPRPGTVDFFKSLDFSGTQFGFQVFLLRPLGHPNEFDVVASQNFLSPGSGTGDIVFYDLPEPWSVQAGDRFAHYGQGIPFDTPAEPSVADTLYSPSPSPPVVPSTITLPSTSFPFASDDRNYFLNANFTPVPAPIPEPRSILLLGIGALGLLAAGGLGPASRAGRTPDP